jgi:hypothetical protein
MGADFLCFICGGPDFSIIYNNDKSIENDAYYKKICNHLNNLVFLTLDNKVIKLCGGRDGYYDYKDNKDNKYSNLFPHMRDYLSKNNNTLFKCGIFCHAKCYNFVTKQYGINLTYSKLPQMQVLFDEGIAMMMPEVNLPKYGKIQKYWDQYFDQDNELIKNGDLYLLDLDDKQTQKQIKSNLKYFGIDDIVIDVDSPQIPAKYFERCMIKIGQNKKFWKNVKDNWEELKDEVLIVKFSLKEKLLKSKSKKTQVDKLKKFINSIPSATESSNNALFIVDVMFDDSNKIIEFTFACSPKMKKVLGKKFF